MAYYNANVYRETPTRFLHDACFARHEDRFEIIGPPGHQLKHQVKPWNWAPIYSLDPARAPACEDCGLPVLGRG